jgi:hypothetical protein
LGRVARERCRVVHPRWGSLVRGRVACAECWEHVIRVDAVVAHEEGLPAGPPVPDPALVDEVAVARACRGVRVRLTAAELAAVVEILTGRGLSGGQIADRLGMYPGRVLRAVRASGSDSGSGAVAA